MFLSKILNCFKGYFVIYETLNFPYLHQPLSILFFDQTLKQFQISSYLFPSFKGATHISSSLIPSRDREQTPSSINSVFILLFYVNFFSLSFLPCFQMRIVGNVRPCATPSNSTCII
jgi:hypothetical protein